MGSLSLVIDPGDPFTMNTATVSCWFRMPSESIATAVARDLLVTVPGSLYSTLRCAAPLVMWGEQVAADDLSHGPIGPSYIGVDGDTDSNPQPGGGEVENGIIVSLQPDSLYSAPASGFNGLVAGFGNFRGPTSSVGARPPVTLDAWHHLFMSWSLVSNESVEATDDDGGIVSGYSTMYCVIDGVSKTGLSLPANWDSRGFGSNDMISNLGMGMFQSAAVAGTGTFSIPKLSNSPLVIPGREVLGELEGSNRANLKVQMGPLQIFGGLMLTPSSLSLFENNRRPTNPNTAETALSVTPHVRISTNEQWTTGTNTGTLGNFSVTGTISAYVPPGSVEYAA